MIRANHPGLTEARLTDRSGGTCTDTWRWNTVEQMQRAGEAAPGIPEVGAAMSLMHDHQVEDGEVIDER